MPRSPLETRKLIRRWDHSARRYDRLSLPMEHMLGFSSARAKLFEGLSGSVLELGVGTGRNIPYYPNEVDVTALDISGQMLAQAVAKAHALAKTPSFVIADVEALCFQGQAFDAVVASGVFCSVLDPLRGFREVKRVLKDGGTLILLEHIRPRAFLGWLFDLLDPLVSRLIGPHINRRTLDTLKQAGFSVVKEENVFSDWVKWIEAVPDGGELRGNK